MMAITNSGGDSAGVHLDTTLGAAASDPALPPEPAPPTPGRRPALRLSREVVGAVSGCAARAGSRPQLWLEVDLARIARPVRWCLSLTGLLMAGWLGFGQENSGFLKRAEGNYRDARSRYQSHTNDAEAAWQFGRACFDLADLAGDNDRRESIANEGIAACRQLVARDPKSAPGHYYLAMDLGQLAQTKTLGALKIVQEMEREFKTARDLEAKFDYAGPDRNLGLLYLEAPGWPASIGSRNNARWHLERAVELAPDFPENRLCLLEAHLKWGEKKNVQRELKTVEDLLPKARKEFTGEVWAQSWVDWNKRWDKIREKTREGNK